MTTSTTQASLRPIDDSPLVRPRLPRVQVLDRDADGTPDVYLYDLDNDGSAEIEHHVAERRTRLILREPRPWEVPPSLTLASAGVVPLRVTHRIRSMGDGAYEVNGVPVFIDPDRYGMESLSLAWDGDRERDEEVRAAMLLAEHFGGVRCVEAL